jgi:hypothetical protein
MNMIKRIILLIAYIAVSIIVTLFFGAGGAGSMAPVLILGSWAMVFARLLMVKSIFVAFIIFLLYLTGLFLLTTVMSRRVETAHPIIPGAVHGIGSLAALAVADEVIGHAAAAFPILVIMSYVFSIAIAWFYLSFDWRLARGSKIDE